MNKTELIALFMLLLSIAVTFLVIINMSTDEPYKGYIEPFPEELTILENLIYTGVGIGCFIAGFIAFLFLVKEVKKKRDT